MHLSPLFRQALRIPVDSTFHSLMSAPRSAFYWTKRSLSLSKWLRFKIKPPCWVWVSNKLRPARPRTESSIAVWSSVLTGRQRLTWHWPKTNLRKKSASSSPNWKLCRHKRMRFFQMTLQSSFLARPSKVHCNRRRRDSIRQWLVCVENPAYSIKLDPSMPESQSSWPMLSSTQICLSTMAHLKQWKG